MTRWPLPLLPVLLLSTGCGALQGSVDWLGSRVADFLPQDPVEVPAPTAHASAVPAAQTGAHETAERTEHTQRITVDPAAPPVEEDDWPELVDCGMG